MVGKLEDFCSSGEFTSIMAEFQDKYCHLFQDTEEQNLE
jgi:hypothetical protein